MNQRPHGNHASDLSNNRIVCLSQYYVVSIFFIRKITITLGQDLNPIVVGEAASQVRPLRDGLEDRVHRTSCFPCRHYNRDASWTGESGYFLSSPNQKPVEISLLGSSGLPLEIIPVRGKVLKRDSFYCLQYKSSSYV